MYLAGPINGCSDEEARGWREHAAQLLGERWECVTPMRRDYRGREAANVARIVEGDKDDIEGCDAVLVMAERPSWGTAMEVYFAHNRGKRVVAICSANPSPWLAYHTGRICSTLADACAYLRETAR